MDGKPLLRISGHDQTILAVALSPDERLVVTAGKDRTARVWDAATGVSRGCFSGHTDWVLAVAFSPEGGRLLTGSADRTARLWDVGAERELRVSRTTRMPC